MFKKKQQASTAIGDTWDFSGYMLFISLSVLQFTIDCLVKHRVIFLLSLFDKQEKMKLKTVKTDGGVCVCVCVCVCVYADYCLSTGCCCMLALI